MRETPLELVASRSTSSAKRSLRADCQDHPPPCQDCQDQPLWRDKEGRTEGPGMEGKRILRGGAVER
eukprot:2436591-Pyramimonas_sp.AAC.1